MAPYCNLRPDTSCALGDVLASRVTKGVTGAAVGVCRSLREAEEARVEGAEVGAAAVRLAEDEGGGWIWKIW